MPTTKLTDLAIRKLKPPAPGQFTPKKKDGTGGKPILSVTYWDNQLPGFGVRISVKGRKTWTAMYRVAGKAVMESLGTVAQIPKVDVARDMARQSMIKAKAGVNAVEEKREQEAAAKAEAEAQQQTFAWLIEHPEKTISGVEVAKGFLPEYARRKQRPSTLYETTRILKRLLPYIGGKLIKDIRRRDIEEALDDIAATRRRKRAGAIGGPDSEARSAQSHLNTVFRWAVRAGHVDINPLFVMDKERHGRPGRRQRVLSDPEIRAFWAACTESGWPYGPIGKLLLLTCQRQGQVSGMRRSELDLREWTLPPERTKNGHQHIVPLSDQVVSIIEQLPRLSGDLVFSNNGGTAVSGFASAKLNFDQIMRRELAKADPDYVLKDWVWHDLRRTGKTRMTRIGVQPHVSEKVLGHITSGLERTYDVYDYLSEKREALERLSAEIERIVGGDTSTATS